LKKKERVARGAASRRRGKRGEALQTRWKGRGGKRRKVRQRHPYELEGGKGGLSSASQSSGGDLVVGGGWPGLRAERQSGVPAAKGS